MMQATQPLRFWSKVDKNGPVSEHRPDLGQCWLWRGATVRDTYGKFNIGGGTLRYAHRLAYELLVGPIPEGLVIDHLCRVKGCVNPAHLEPVTNSENLRRGLGPTLTRARPKKTHCPSGHPFDEANTREYRGRRHCRACDRKRSARRVAA